MRLDRLLLLLLYLAHILAILIVLHGLGAHVHAFAVLTHGEVGLSLADVGADEVGVALNGLVAVLDSAGERQQLDEAGGAVRVAARVVRRALDHLAIGFHRGRPVGFFELGVAELARFFGFSRADVGLFLSGYPGLFGGTEFRKNFWGPVLSQGALIVEDSVRKIAKLFVG